MELERAVTNARVAVWGLIGQIGQMLVDKADQRIIELLETQRKREKLVEDR